MKALLKRSWIFVLLTLCALGAAAVILVGRARVEANCRTYDVVVDFTDLSEMAAQSDTPMDEWLELFHDHGMTKMALYEESIKTLTEDVTQDVTYSKPSVIMTQYGWREACPQKVVELMDAAQDNYDLLITVGEPELYAWMLDAIDARTDKMDYTAFTEDGVGYIWIDGTYTLSGGNWIELPLGLLPEKVALLQSHGFTVIPRTRTNDNMNTAQFARAVLGEYAQFDTPYFMNGGDGLLGWEDQGESRQLLLDYLEESGAALCVTEEMDQSQNVTWPGFDSFVMDDLDCQAVRVFNEYGFIQNRWQYYGYSGSEEIVNSLFRAVVERNCRIAYLKMILRTDDEDIYITRTDAYATLLDSLQERMASAGLTLGTVKAMEPYQAPWYLRLVMGFGCVGGALLLLDMLFGWRSRWRWVLLGLGFVAVAGAFYCVPNGVRLLLSIGSAVLFPCLTGVGLYRLAQADRWRGTPGFGGVLLRCVGAVAFCGVGSLLGACTAAAALSESSFMLEMELYRGVKLMQLAPIAFLTVVFVMLFTVEDSGLRPRLVAWEEGFVTRRRDIQWRREQRDARKAFLDQNIHVRDMIAICGLALLAVAGIAAGVYYIMRTGNTNASVDVPQLEIKLRNLLENVLVARPRTKEFLIGWPCLMLLVYTLYHKNRIFSLLFAMGTALGLTSVVNTFQHIRTPLYLSFMRTGYGLALGLALGLIAILVLELLRRIVAARRLPDA